MTPRLKCCLWCDAVFVGSREDFCQRSCGDAWRRVETRRKRLLREKRNRRIAAASKRYWLDHRTHRRAA